MNRERFLPSNRTEAVVYCLGIFFAISLLVISITNLIPLGYVGVVFLVYLYRVADDWLRRDGTSRDLLKSWGIYIGVGFIVLIVSSIVYQLKEASENRFAVAFFVFINVGILFGGIYAGDKYLIWRRQVAEELVDEN